MLPYLDDYLLAAGYNRGESTEELATLLALKVDMLLNSLGLVRHPSKGCWVAGGTTRIEHLGVVMEAEELRFYITTKKLNDIHSLAKSLLSQVRQHGKVSHSALQHFLGKCISNMLPIPLARFYCRALYTDLCSGKRTLTTHGHQIKLSKPSVRDLTT